MSSFTSDQTAGSLSEKPQRSDTVPAEKPAGATAGKTAEAAVSKTAAAASTGRKSMLEKASLAAEKQDRPDTSSGAASRTYTSKPVTVFDGDNELF